MSSAADSDSHLQSLVLRLGNFHTQMSFLGCIGHLIGGTGLQEAFELVYAENVVHILNGKAYSRAVRAHLLMDAALSAILTSGAFDLPWILIHHQANDALLGDESDDSPTLMDTSVAEEVSDMEEIVLLNTDAMANPSTSLDMFMSQTGCASSEETGTSNMEALPQVDHEDLDAAVCLLERLAAGDISAEEAVNHDVVSKINKRLEEHKESVSRSRTSSLCFQYLDMVGILKKSIKAERTGRFDLHLQSVAFFFAAAGHHNYAKSARLYLQQMMALKDTHPKVYQDYQEGHHVFQRSDRYWAGLSQELVIEQVLMRSLKTSGGLTRVTGFGERQRLVWLLSMPACAEISSAMQTLSGVTFTTSEQHKETDATRQAHDHKDTQTLVSYLTDRSPFLSDPSLRIIASGRVADDTAKLDAKNIGKKILDGMTEKNVPEVIRKKDLAVTLATKLAVRVNDEPIIVDPLVLFQRLLKTAQSTPETIPSLFKYELTNLPCALLDSSGLPRQASKSTLAECLWSSAKEETTLPNENIHFVLDGGSLLHKLPWQRGSTYNQLVEMYAEFVARKYKNTTIVFDGYSTQQTTKAATHIRRHGTSVQVNFTGDMILQDTPEKFLANPSNKQRFINLLSETLMKLGFQIHHAKDDADCLIVKTTLDVAASSTTVLIGEDTDLLVLLLYHVTDNLHGVYFMPSGRKAKLWDIKTARAKIGTETCKRLLFAHAISGCDTTSRMMNIGKSLPVKLLRKSTLFQKIADVFMAANTHQETEEAGEKAVVLLTVWG